ncbi:hypothetical protein P775_27835 [Puniceibacterium antarcticum]|uniref:Periplasmic binding protein domain-containing protein n=1 Tax=Puniceibacterium antarcticum TaxID=1206336 RepID=A0A2G8QXZ5_9RHOB|nr:hypothetical protein P775_27835 [Puniceibacterium antarcticum]
MIGKVNVAGLGLPSEMAGAVESGASQSFAIWNPVDLCYNTAMIAHALAAKEVTAEPGATISTDRMGSVTLEDTNTAAMSETFTYDKSNMEEFKSLF